MKRIATLFLSLLMLSFVLSGCGKDDNTLTMATNAAFAPYEYYEGDEIVGIDAEIAAKIAEKLGMELEIKDMEFGSIIGAVQSGSVDMGMAGMTVDPDRLKSVNFTDSYAKGIQVVIVKEDSDIASIDDLAGKTIGVQESTTGDQYATDDYGDDNVKRYNKGSDAVTALNGGIITPSSSTTSRQRPLCRPTRA